MQGAQIQFWVKELDRSHMLQLRACLAQLRPGTAKEISDKKKKKKKKKKEILAMPAGEKNWWCEEAEAKAMGRWPETLVWPVLGPKTGELNSLKGGWAQTPQMSRQLGR